MKDICSKFNPYSGLLGVRYYIPPVSPVVIQSYTPACPAGRPSGYGHNASYKNFGQLIKVMIIMLYLFIISHQI